MKKTFKRLGAALLAMAMAVSVLCTGALAEDTKTYQITINGKSTGHTYEAYRVFKGDLTKVSDANEGTKAVYSLANIQWDDEVVDSTALLSALKTDTDLKTAGKSDFENCTTAEDVANVLSTNTGYTGTDATKTQKFATLVGKNLKTNATHTDSTEGATSNNVTSYTVNVPAGYYFIKDKNDSLKNENDKAYTRYILEVVGPQTVNSKDAVPTLNKTVKGANNEWGKVNDNQIGDTVEFRVTTSVPDITGYTNYTYKIDDTMSAGLTSNVKSVDDIQIKVNDQTALDKQYYSVTVDDKNSNHFTVTVNIKEAISAGVMKSGDTLYTYYSGVLNENANAANNTDKDNNTNSAKLTYSNDPNGNGTGTTTEKKVYDWTFKIVLDKVDKTAGTTLDGAKFVLSKSSNLQNLTEDNVGQNTFLISLIKGTDSTYTIAPENAETTTTTKIIEAGNINIKGLDAGQDYYLYEITAPNGYNKLNDPVHFKITAQYNEAGSELTQGYPQISVDDGNASADLTVKVENSSGKLPSTGGMGTTLFYIIGGVLMAGAAVVLVIKKKRSSAE
ncbi:SpaA isopeptide-forming pilin-related protein [Butyricicoccus sp.]|uniref:SpaA isopeptide-forming pilin-related protein n=1 Tax=Butyricicoccus sp. TaxID=2049021 RepID=UPI003D7DB544